MDKKIAFVEWAKLKIRLDLKDKGIMFGEREIWWASLGMNIGFEQNGKNETFERPILILKKFNLDLFWMLPLTSKEKIGKYYFFVEYKGEKSYVILSQIRLISNKRLLRKIRMLPKKEFDEIKKKIKKFL